MVSWNAPLVLVAVLSLGVGASASAAESTQPGVIERNDGVAFVTGGVGDDQLAALRKLEHPNLKLVFAEAAAAGGHHPYVAEVDVRVLDEQGAEIVASKDAGPLLLADLPSGDYRIEATLRGRTQTKKASVTRGKPTQVAFYW